MGTAVGRVVLCDAVDDGATVEYAVVANVVGAAVDVSDGATEGADVGAAVGASVGCFVGAADGTNVGAAVDVSDGATVGSSVVGGGWVVCSVVVGTFVAAVGMLVVVGAKVIGGGVQNPLLSQTLHSGAH
jgi:hypothetical protein